MKACEICGGLRSFGTSNMCPFCSGTKESSAASNGLIKHHICGCITQIERTARGARNHVIMMHR